MRQENLYETIHAQPFRPFVLVTADGSKIEVPHPEMIAFFKGSRTALVLGKDESAKIVDVALVTTIEMGPPVPAGQVAPEPDGGA
jgi:hypothetical protein